jgi:hypothetical protein
MEVIIGELDGVPWAQPLINGIKANGGLTGANKALLFELRFGYALRRAGITPRYEIPGEGGSTLDFGFTYANQAWAVELMRLEETVAVRRATRAKVDEDGVPFVHRMLTSPHGETKNENEAQESIEGETIKAVERICQKCARGDGQPHKFPVPDGAMHAILVDFRTFLHGGDVYDRMHVGLGGELVPQAVRLYWEGKLISGVFSPRTKLRGATQAQERVHFIGFVRDRIYNADEFATVTQFVVNPHLLARTIEIESAISTWPLTPSRVLNSAAGWPGPGRR